MSNACHRGKQRFEGAVSGSKQTIRVLVVDDSVDAADGLAAVLSSANYDARAAYDGASAVALATSFRPHLVVLDIEMPGMNGYQTAQALRQSATGNPQVLVAYTAQPDPGSEAATVRAGFDLHINKPCEIRDLLRLLERTLASVQYNRLTAQSLRRANG